MNELDDIEALAAEYVLGTLSREERRAVASRRENEQALDAAIAAWERRLGPLAEVVRPCAARRTSTARFAPGSGLPPTSSRCARASRRSRGAPIAGAEPPSA